jgi:GT2 family glycosyltransferase
MTLVVAILACHDRMLLTVRALDALERQTAFPEVELEVVVVDDGSSDGTADAIADRWPETTLLRGDGTLYWARAMQLAEEVALTRRPDFVLWLNDDVELWREALATLLVTARSEPGTIVVGPVADPISGEVAYSGIRFLGGHPLRVEPVIPRGEIVEADTFNGNVVLVPGSIADALDGIDGSFEHGMADFDYGLRARNLGIRTVIAPTYLGTCRRNRALVPWRDDAFTTTEQWRKILSPKGLPPASYARYLRRHGGLLWPVFWVAPYARLSARSALRQARASALQASKRPTRISGRDDKGRYVVDNHARGANHAPATDGHAFENR